MRVYVESVLACAPEKVWGEVQTSALLLEIIHPLARILPLDPPQFPPRWQQGATVRCKLYFFGLIPLGTHTLFLERIDQDAREIQSREHDWLVHRWDHLIRVRQTADGQTLYSDEIEIGAGIATVIVWLFAQGFYRHRQRRWRRVAKRLAAAVTSSPAPESPVPRSGDRAS